MRGTRLHPWTHEALQQAGIERGARVLQLTAHETAQAAATLELCGKSGTLVVLEPSATLADRTRRIAGADVVTTTPDGSESFGLFDAVIACPTWNPSWSVEQWSDSIRSGLRPGGRFVLDLPAETLCEALDVAWRRAGGSDDLGARWHGLAEDDVASGLRDGGLRNVEGEVGVHLVRFESPFVLAEFGAEDLDDPDFEATLARVLVEDLKTTGEVEVIFRRTRVHGMR